MIKILTHYAHESYQTALSEIPNTKYYHVIDTDAERFPRGELPTRFWADGTQLPSNIVPIKAADVDPKEFDLMLIHWHPFISSFGKLWGKILPMVMTEHTWPYNNLKSEVFRWKEIRRKYCDHTVFITPSSKNAWGASNDPQASYIYHSFDINKFPRKTVYNGTQVMTTTNEFISRDWACGFSLWSKVLGVPGKAFFDNIALYGYGNKNIGPVSKGKRTRKEILDLLCNAGLYFNPSIMSPIPMSLLEAAAIGTPIVSTAYCEPGTIFKDKEHGVISNGPVELREGIKYVLSNPEVAKRRALKAREVVKHLFDPIRFRKEWLKVFNSLG